MGSGSFFFICMYCFISCVSFHDMNVHNHYGNVYLPFACRLSSVLRRRKTGGRNAERHAASVAFQRKLSNQWRTTVTVLSVTESGSDVGGTFTTQRDRTSGIGVRCVSTDFRLAVSTIILEFTFRFLFLWWTKWNWVNNAVLHETPWKVEEARYEWNHKIGWDKIMKRLFTAVSLGVTKGLPWKNLFYDTQNAFFENDFLILFDDCCMLWFVVTWWCRGSELLQRSQGWRNYCFGGNSVTEIRPEEEEKWWASGSKCTIFPLQRKCYLILLSYMELYTWKYVSGRRLTELGSW